MKLLHTIALTLALSTALSVSALATASTPTLTPKATSLSSKAATPKISVKKHKRQKELKDGKQTLLTLDITYPQFTSSDSKRVEAVNQFYRKQADDLQHYAMTELLPWAKADYKERSADKLAFFPYSAGMDFTVTNKSTSAFSLYVDTYDYTGGAHGMTYRSSGTWDFRTGKQLTLSDFFPSDKNYKATLIKEMQTQAAKEQATEEGIFFDEYLKSIEESFDETHFYLTPKGIVVYYQLYEIGPYVRGFVEFLIPNTKAPK